jgi:ketosteroid isomerase-like protein
VPKEREMLEGSASNELKTAFESTVRSYNEGDLESYFAAMHENVSYYLPSRREPLIGKRAVREMYSAFLSRLERYHWEPISPEFVVAGACGIVFSEYRHTFTRMGETEVAREGRNTVVFAVIDGRWMKVAESL